jgi:hypothetical protein
MRAVEFISKPHDDVVDLPAELSDWNGRRVRVILLAEEGRQAAGTVRFSAIAIKTQGFHFDREEANAR